MKAYWHYYIIDAREAIKHLKIEADGSPIVFKNPELVSLPNGQQSYRISSSDSEPLEQSYDYSLLLKGVIAETNQEFTMKLPFPDANHIRLDSGGEKQVDLYIYL